MNTTSENSPPKDIPPRDSPPKGSPPKDMATDNDRARRRKNRLQLLAILAIVLVPALGSTFMYYTGIGMPEGTNNKGTLVAPPIELADIPLYDRDKRSWNWGDSGNFRLALLVDGTCNQVCADLLHNMRQVHVLLAKRSTSLERWLVQLDENIRETPIVTGEQTLATTYPRLSQVRGNLRQWRQRLRHHSAVNTDFNGEQVLLIDRRGNLVMAFDREQSEQGMLDDLKFLIKSTQ